MIVDSQALWVAQTNAWVVARESGGPALVIDAPPDVDGIARLLARHDLYPAASMLTHGHVDHTGGAEALERLHHTITHVHPDDDFLTLDPRSQLRMLFGVAAHGFGDIGVPTTTRPLADGQRIEVAGVEVDVRHTPGHTPGHCCFLVASEGWLFSGDQLFAGSIGRTDLPGGDLLRLLESMRDRVLDLPDDTRVLPGHGPETTIGRERRSNPFIAGLVGG